MKLTYHDNTKDYIKMLSKKHGGLAITGSETVNEAAKIIHKAYDDELDKFTIRNKYTKGAVKLELSKPQRSSGEFRTLNKINAIVGVRKQKGGKDHYLKLQEEGGTKKGSALTLGKVAVPFNASRQSGLYKLPIGGKYRLFGNLFQSPTVGQVKFGMNDGFTPRQRFAIASKYIKTTKMFIMQTVWGTSVFAKILGEIEAVRGLFTKSIPIKATHKLEKSVQKINAGKMEDLFVKNAKKFMNN